MRAKFWARLILTIMGAMLAVALLGTLITGCSQIANGRVLAREYHPAYSYTTMIPMCASYGKYGCNTYIFIPNEEYVGPEWELHLKNAQDDGWRDVTETEYNKYRVGDEYP